MKIAVCIPSRGTIYSQTVEEVLKNVEGFDYQIFWSHANPIPDCFNLITEQALADKKVTHLWFVEEDMVLPDNILKHLLEEMTIENVSAVAADYPLIETPSATVYRDPYGKAYFTGCGCLLVKREVFDKKPYWRADVTWRLDIKPDRLIVTPKWTKGKVYGQQDITFGISLYLKENPILVSKMTCGQRKIVVSGNKDSNSGFHQIVEYNEIARARVFEKTDSNLIEIRRKTDKYDRMHVFESQLDGFLASGKFELARVGSLELDDDDGIWEKIK